MFREDFKPGFVLNSPAIPVSDGSGGYTEGVAFTPFRGRIRKLRAREVIAGGKRTTVATHRIYADGGLIVTEKKTITYDGNTYNVIEPYDVMDRGSLFQIDVEIRK